MFLTENTVMEGSANPSYMYEAVLEANEAYHDLCMKMIKCEHASIINNNTEMLNEAEKDFKGKVEAIARKALAKFMAFIDRVKAEWSKLWASTISKFVNREKVNEMLKGVQSMSIKVSGVNVAGLRAAKTLYNRVSMMNGEKVWSIDSQRSILGDELKDVESNSVTTLTVQHVKEAVSFLEERPKWIKDLEKFKKNAQDAYRKDVKENNGQGDGLAVTKYSSLISKVISVINKQTTTAVKICRAALKQYNPSKENKAKVLKAEQNKEKKTNAMVLKAEQNKQESYSILDMF